MSACPAPGELREERLRLAAATVERPEPLSPAQRDAILPPDALESILGTLGPHDAKRLLTDWGYWGRPSQQPPPDPDWVIWMILSGRGWGKTRTGAEWMKAEIDSGDARAIGLVGPTLGDVWDQMVHGDDSAPGLVRLYDHFPEALRPKVNTNARRIYFPHNGARAKIFTAEEPEIRGPNIRRWWCDELAKWKHLESCWNNIELTLRAKGKTPPRVCITTTPRPLALVKELLDDPEVRCTFGSTFANAANLAPSFLRRIMRRFGGSRLGLQELFGLVLGDNPDALFHGSTIDAHRRARPPKITRIAIAVDPAISTNNRSDLTGIVVIGLGDDGHLYVIADLTGIEFDRKSKDFKYWFPEEPRKHAPEEWGEIVCRAYRYFGALYSCPAFVVGERNRGGDLVKSNVMQVDRLSGGAGAIPYQEVRATRGKAARAEEVSTLYQQGRVHHVGQLPLLETEQTEWNPKLTPVSPNRIDALVWGAFFLVPELGSDPEPDRAGTFAGFEEAQAKMPAPAFAAISKGEAEEPEYDRV